jgi:hypothetical protein
MALIVLDADCAEYKNCLDADFADYAEYKNYLDADYADFAEKSKEQVCINIQNLHRI